MVKNYHMFMANDNRVQKEEVKEKFKVIKNVGN